MEPITSKTLRHQANEQVSTTLLAETPTPTAMEGLTGFWASISTKGKLDTKKLRRFSSAFSKKESADKTKTQSQCFYCKGYGHKKADCKKFHRDNDAKEGEVTCIGCKNKGHTIADCRKFAAFVKQREARKQAFDKARKSSDSPPLSFVTNEADTYSPKPFALHLSKEYLLISTVTARPSYVSNRSRY